MLNINVWHIESRIGCSIASWNDSADGFALCAVFPSSPFWHITISPKRWLWL